jgi:hypothetical protein
MLQPRPVSCLGEVPIPIIGSNERTSQPCNAKSSLTFPPIFIATFEYRNNVLVCRVRVARIFDGNGQRRKTVKHGNLGGRFGKDGG